MQFVFLSCTATKKVLIGIRSLKRFKTCVDASVKFLKVHVVIRIAPISISIMLYIGCSLKDALLNFNLNPPFGPPKNPLQTRNYLIGINNTIKETF